jgi:hypothetical protein
MDVRWPPPAASRGEQKALELALYVPAPTRRRSGASTAVFVAPTGDAPAAIAVRGGTEVAREAITLPELLIDSRRLAPTRSAPPRFLLVAPPEAAAVAHRLWDMMVARLGADRVVFDHDGRVFGTQLDDGANAGMVSERVDAVLLLADADPSSWLPLAVRRAIWEERVPLLSVPLTENWAAARGRWPKSLHRAAQRAAFHGQPVPPVGWIGHGDEDAFHLVLELLEAWRPDGWSDPRESTSPAVPSAAEPAPPSIGMSLRSRFATMLDKRTDDELGLFRVALRPTGFSLERASAWPSDTRPALLLVHGELSDVQGTFAHLLTEDSPERRALAAAFGDRLFAWRWRSVTVGPLRNAAHLARALGSGGPARVLALGGGGLLPELLAFAESGIEPGFDAALQDLIDAVASRPPHVERFVRVACPTGGSNLYRQGLDRALGALGSVIGFALKVPTVAARWVASDPATTPGLTALIPDAAVLRLLSSRWRTRMPLTVVTGVATPKNVPSWLVKLVASWPLDGDDHDLVVSLESAFGGLERHGGVDYLIDRGPDVTHFNYLRNPRTRRAIVDALIGPVGTPRSFAHGESLAEVRRRVTGSRRGGEQS